MIIDTLANASKYFRIHPEFENAFRFIETHQILDKTENETFEISENLRAFVSNFFGLTKNKALETFECHNKNIDIQLCINGKETFGWKPRENCSSIKEAYMEEKDVMFFNESPDFYFELKRGQFVIFFPEDVHAPGISNESITKLVVKVKK